MKIDKEFKALIPSLKEHEKLTLEQNLKTYGCLTPLIVWSEKNILLDGHHRWEFIQKYGLEYETETISLPDREAAVAWIEYNQLGRRNLTADWYRYLMGKKYEREKKNESGRADRDFSGGQNVHPKTADKIAKEHGTDEKTVRRAADYAKSVDTIAEVAGPEAKQTILSDEESLKGSKLKNATKAAKKAKKAKQKKTLDELKQEQPVQKEKTSKPKPFQINDGRIISEFITNQKSNTETVYCPHFMELKWANGCHYDCAWCYLKGTYYGKTAFREKPWPDIVEAIAKAHKEIEDPILLNAGELADGLGGETSNNSSVLPLIALFGKLQKHRILLLTKSNKINHILNIPQSWKQFIVFSWSLNADKVAKQWEKEAPTVKERIAAAKEIADAGFEVRIRVDPIVPIENWKKHYEKLMKDIFDSFQPSRVTLGTLRMVNSNVLKYTWNKEWKKYFKTKTGWGAKITESQRIECYKTIANICKKHNINKIGLCKETEKIRNEINVGKCNCEN